MLRPRTRLKDIADATGYSANTVSLALRGSPRIPEETRDRIQSAARSLNYFPNTIAQALVSRETRTIGLILTDEELRSDFLERPTETLNALRERGFELTNTELDALKKTDRRLWAVAAEWIDDRLRRIRLDDRGPE